MHVCSSEDQHMTVTNTANEFEEDGSDGIGINTDFRPGCVLCG